MSENVEKKIFVSYSWTNSLQAREIANILKQHRYKVWIDINSLDLNRNLYKQIIEGIISSDYFLLIHSSTTRESDWVRYETRLAKSLLPNSKVFMIDIDTNYVSQYCHSNNDTEFLSLLKLISNDISSKSINLLMSSSSNYNFFNFQ